VHFIPTPGLLIDGRAAVVCPFSTIPSLTHLLIEGDPCCGMAKFSIFMLDIEDNATDVEACTGSSFGFDSTQFPFSCASSSPEELEYSVSELSSLNTGCLPVKRVNTSGRFTKNDGPEAC